MRSRSFFTLTILSGLLFCALAWCANDTANVAPGTTKQDLLNSMGQPDLIGTTLTDSQGRHVEVWMYSVNGMAYYVTLTDDVVTDAALKDVPLKPKPAAPAAAPAPAPKDKK